MTTTGILFGLISGAAFGLTNVLVRPVVHRCGADVAVWWANVISTLCVGVALVASGSWPALARLFEGDARPLLAFALAGLSSLALARSLL